jgi:2-polyprenyl-6-methoxyphenol hydroxylase-like FAD-dependent oxidoreductase
MYDAIVVGARCAGSTTAMLLARQGYKVLLVDKATFPSDTMSTLYLHPTAMTLLERWGLVEQLRAGNAPAIRQWVARFDDVLLTGFPWSPDGVTESFAPRRTVLDKILVDGAASAGAVLREGVVFEDVLRAGDVVTGVRCRTKAGVTFEERARVVVGADGLRSPVAEAVGASRTVDRPSLTCAYYAFYSGLGEPVCSMYARARRWVATFPTNDGLSLVYVGLPHAEFPAFKADIEGNFLATLEAVSAELAARVRAGKREERFVGTADLPGFFRRAHGAGWALVGDAGYHKDPCTAQGMSDAFRGADQLASAIDDGLSGKKPLQNALAEYEQRRNERAMPMFEWTCRVAEMKPLSPKMASLLAAIKVSQEDTNRFLGLNAGTVLAPEFFAPDNIARILAAGPAASS